jgi:hypothetical protein
MLIAKIALGLASTVAFATVYTFREGVIRVDVDEFRSGGSHVHFWVPAAAVPMAVHFAPKEHMREAAEKLDDWMPTVRQLTKELRKYPDADFIDVEDGSDHVQIRTRAGKLQIDVRQPGEEVHIACPIATIEDLSFELGNGAPGA